MTQLILLPGMDGTGNLFNPLTSALKKDIDYQILTYPLAKLQPPSDRVTIPSLYIQGKDDYLVPSQNLEAFKKHCQNLTVHTIKGPHFLLQAQPQRCAKRIKAFTEGLATRTSFLPK